MRKNFISMLLLSAASMLPICSYADDGGNKWTVNPVTVTTGATEVTLPVLLNNPMTITGVQFDIYLPTGVSIKTTGRTKTYSIEKGTARYEDLNHSLSSALQNDGAVRVLCVSTTNTPIWDDDAEGEDIRGTESLINITLSLEEGLNAGAYDVAFKNITLTHFESNTDLYSLDDVYAQVLVRPESGVVENTADNIVSFSSATGAKVTKTEYQNYIQTQEDIAVVDLRSAEIDESITVEDLRQNLEGNALIVLPSGSSITGENIIVGEKCSQLKLDDCSLFKPIIPFTAETVQYERDLSGVGTICLPYAPTTDNFDYYELDAVDASALRFVKVETPKANTPYLFMKKGSDNIISGNNVKIKVVDEQNISKGQWTMHGTYSQHKFTSADNIYALSASKLFRNTGELTMSPFHAYFTYSGNDAKDMMISIDGEAMAIENLNDSKSSIVNSQLYNLAGQAVGKDYKGIVIINGRKELRK